MARRLQCGGDMRTMTIALCTLFGCSAAWAEAPAPQPQQEQQPPPQAAPPQAAPAYPPGHPPPAYRYAPGYPPPQYPPPAYLPGMPPPPVRYELRPNYGLLFAGVGVLGLGYLLDISGTLLTSHQPAWECAIPVVGPYLQVDDTFSSDWGDLAKAFYVTDALFQTAGLVLTVLGASLWHKVPVRVAQNGFAVTF